MWRPARQPISAQVLWCQLGRATDRPYMESCDRSNGLINHELAVANAIHHKNHIILLTNNCPITPRESNPLFSFMGGVMWCQSDGQVPSSDLPTHASVNSQNPAADIAP